MRKRVVSAVGGAFVVLSVAIVPAHAAELGSAGGFTYVKKSKDLGDTTGGGALAEKPEAHCSRRPVSQPVAACPFPGDPLASFVSASGPKQNSWLGCGWHFDTPAGKVTTSGICTEETEQGARVLQEGHGCRRWSHGKHPPSLAGRIHQ